jgi:hypothetical protein
MAMALLETKEKMANSLGFRRFKMNPGTATDYHLIRIGSWDFARL